MNSSLPTGEDHRALELAEAKSRRRRETRRFAAALLVLGLGLVISVGLATRIGRMDLSWASIGAVLLSKLGLYPAVPDRTTEVVVWGIRLSRVVLSGLVGASLATAGVVFQGILLNPLADPFTIGVSTGAAFGVALLVMLGVGGSLWGLSPLPLAALMGALGAMAAVLVLSRSEGGRIRKESLILAGIVVSTFLSALISLIKSLDEESLSAIVFWIMGSFSGRGWIHVGFLLPYAVLGLVLAMSHSRELDILALGEEQSRSPRPGRSPGAAQTPAGRLPAHRRGGGRLRRYRFCRPGGAAHGADSGRPLPWPPAGFIRRRRGADLDLGRRAGPGPPEQRPGAPRRSGHGPVGGAFLLLPAEVPAGQGDLVIRVEALNLGYEGRLVLHDLNFQIEPGEFVGILGPNGSGKSTLLHALSGLLSPQGGRIIVREKTLESLTSRLRAQILAVVPQTTEVRFPFACLEIVLMGRYPHRKRLETLTDDDLLLGPEIHAPHHHRPSEATAHHRGFRRRMPAGGDRPGPGPGPPDFAVGRGHFVLGCPQKTGDFYLLRYLNETRGLTVLCAMHDLNLAALYCRRLMFLKDGAIVQDGATERSLPRRSWARSMRRPWKWRGTRAPAALRGDAAPGRRRGEAEPLEGGRI